ncbi:MAG TPA: 3-hydroxybutyryl-CoA dehydrogenase [Cyanobacteria bacterium UBA8530]|nr:3-hydroxybutyryl-CoA dehydrogenase [Cyanobacteria bacterium UBA8530]
MIENVAVIGMGKTGAHIARLTALAGYRTTIRDLSRDLLEATLHDIGESYKRLVSAGLLGDKEADAALKRLFPEVVIEKAVITSDLVFEALPDLLELKRELFVELDHLSPPHSVLVTTTAIHSVSEISAVTKRPESCLGMHWMGDPQVTSLVEIVKGFKTATATLEIAQGVAEKMKQDWLLVQDAEGFVCSRLLTSLILECSRLTEEGVATMEDVDRAMSVIMGLSPLALADSLGLDKIHAAALRLTEAYGERFLPTQDLERRVKARCYGKSTGCGFFPYGTNVK